MYIVLVGKRFNQLLRPWTDRQKCYGVSKESFYLNAIGRLMT